MIMIGDVVLQDDETVLGFFSRVASDHRMTLEQFCQFKGTTIAQLAYGKPSALQRACEQWKVDAAVLIGRSIVPGPQFDHIQNEHNRYRKLDLRSIRFCPRCIVSDLQTIGGKSRTRPYQRLAWLSPFVFQCVTHKTDLIEVAERTELAILGDFAGSMSGIADQLRGLADAAMEHAPSPASAYFHGRMTLGFTSEPVLDGMPTFAAANICAAFGKMAAAPHPDSELRLRLSDGFHIVRGGKESIVEFLDAYCAAPSAGRQRTVRATYGAVYDLLRGNKSAALYEPVREYVKSHGLENLPLGEGEGFLGGRAAKRKFHTVHSAAVEYGISDRDVILELERQGVVDRHTNHRGEKFDVERIDAVLSGVAVPLMSSSDLRSRTGMTADMVFKLVRGGVLSTRGPVNRPKFRVDEVERFTSSLFGNLTPCAPEDAVPLYSAARMSGRRHELVIAIFQGRLKAFSVRNEADTLQDIRVRPSDLPNLRKKVFNCVERRKQRARDHADVEKGHARNWDGFVAVAQAIRRMRVGDVTMSHLLEAGHLPFTPSTGGTRYIPVDALEEFMATYIPFHEAKKLYGRRKASFKKWLHKSGVIPALEPKFSNIATFYLRSEVMALISSHTNDVS